MAPDSPLWSGLVALLRIALFSPLLLLAGALVARAALGPRRSDTEDDSDRAVWLLAVALGWGFGVVPSLAFYFYLFTDIKVAWWNVLIAALASGAVAARVLRRRSASGEGYLEALLPRSPSRRLLRSSAPVLVAVALVGTIFFLKHDNRAGMPFSCIYIAARVAADPHMAVPNLLGVNVEDARLGNTGVLAGFLALYGPFGYRLLHGVCGMLCALAGWMIARSLGGGPRSPRWGWVGLVLLPMNPYILGFPQVDENLLTLSFSAALLPILISGRAPGLGGVFFGLVIAMRHILLPAVAAIPVLLRQTKERLVFLGAFVLMTFPENLHHRLAMGSFFRMESNEQFPPMPYRFGGMDLKWEGLLNWPVHDHVVRTPHEPFPTFLRWPLYLADHLGLALFAVMLVGFVAIWRASKRHAAFWALWSLAVIALLAVQECWDHVNKMGVIIIVFGAFVAWMTAGAAWTLRRPLVGVPLVLALVAASYGAMASVRDWRPPMDERYHQVRHLTREDPKLVEEAAIRDTDIGPLPDYGRLNRWGPFVAAGKLLELPTDLVQRSPGTRSIPTGWFMHEMPPPGNPVTIELDLSERPHGRTDIARVVDAPADAEIRTSPEVVAFSGLEAPWSDRELVVYVGRMGAVTLVYIFRGEETGDQDLIDDRLGQIYGMSGRLDLMKHPHGHPAPPRLKREKPRIRISSGGLTIALEINVNAERCLLWKGPVTTSSVSLSRPTECWHN